MRQEVLKCLPFNTSFGHIDLAAITSSSFFNLRYCGELWYPRGSLVSIVSNFTILSIGSTTCLEQQHTTPLEKSVSHKQRKITCTYKSHHGTRERGHSENPHD